MDVPLHQADLSDGSGLHQGLFTDRHSLHLKVLHFLCQAAQVWQHSIMTLLSGSNRKSKCTAQTVRLYSLLLDCSNPTTLSPSMQKAPKCLAHCVLSDWSSYAMGSDLYAFSTVGRLRHQACLMNVRGHFTSQLTLSRRGGRACDSPSCFLLDTRLPLPALTCISHRLMIGSRSEGSATKVDSPKGWIWLEPHLGGKAETGPSFHNQTSHVTYLTLPHLSHFDATPDARMSMPQEAQWMR